MKRTLSIFLTAILLVLTVAVAVPSASAVSADVAQTAAYAIPNPAFTVESGTHGVLVAWNADSRVDHYRVYHKTADGWSKIADNIKVGYYFDTSVVKGKSYTFTVRGLNSSNSFVTDYNRSGRTVAFTSYPDKYLLGDTDTDGTVTVMDATLIQRKLVELNIGDCKYIDCLGDSDEDGSLGITDATMIQRYTAAIPIPYPVGGKLPDIIGVGGAVAAPTNVKVVSGTKGTKNYKKVLTYGLTSNLSTYNNEVYMSLVNPEPVKNKLLTDDSYIESTFEYLDNGKVRVNFKLNAPDKINWVKWWIQDDSEEWFKAADVPISTFKNGSGYYDYQMPELEDERVYPSVDVTWGKSSNAEGYDVVIKDAKGNAVSKVVTVGKNATSATVQLTTFDAGTFTAEVIAKSGKDTSEAKGTFTIKSSFVEDKAAEVIKTPIVEYVDGVCVCNNCGMAVTGKVKDHIITDREYQIMMTEEPIYYDGKTLVAGWCGYHYFTGGGATIPIRTYYWENAPHSFKVSGRSFNPVFTTDRIEQLASTGWKEDGTFGPYEYPNPTPERTCTRDWCFGPKGVLFTESQMLEMLSTSEKHYYSVNDAEALLEEDMAHYHGYVQGCSAGYHMESRSRITGINELHVPATGHYEFTVN